LINFGAASPENFAQYGNPARSRSEIRARFGDSALTIEEEVSPSRLFPGVPFSLRSRGVQRLVQFYNEAAEDDISVNAVMVHEMLLHLNWLNKAAKASYNNQLGGHGPEHYATMLGAILQRTRSGQ
jgi:hypothetical protein